MVTPTLLEPKLAEGAQLIAELDAAGFPVPTAMWLYFEESEAWRLVLSSPVVDVDGPSEGYLRVQQVLLAHPHSIRLDETTVVGTNYPVVAALRQSIKSRPGPEGMRVTGNILNGVYIQDAHVYRIG